MKTKKQIIGKYGEGLAKNYLSKHGYSILESNLKLSFYELDIVAKKSGVYAFVEVKTQLAINNISPELSLNQKQIKNLKRGISLYCRIHKIPISSTRLDCIAINLNKPSKLAKIKHFKDILY
jgi:putative endonuclease